MRLIDAEALVKDFSVRTVSARNWKENALNNGNEEIVIRADATLDFLTEVKLTIENAPTVEDRPTGKWESPFPVGDITYHKCSNCHISTQLILITNYCPNCGAKMEESDDE